MANDPTILIVAQDGRLTYEAVLFAASLRHAAPDWTGQLVVAEPAKGPLWQDDPSMTDRAARQCLERLGADIRSFSSRHFGANYPHGNKIEALSVLAPEEPFVFFDTDTLITGPLNDVRFPFDRPSASMMRQNTWPDVQLYGPGYTDIWSALYNRFGIPFEATLDLSQPDEHWERYLYFNAGWFYFECPHRFQSEMLRIMLGIRDEPLPELVCQKLDPWLDQIALPLAITSLGGGRPGTELDGLDGDMTLHWRAMPLFYARATPDQLDLLEEVCRPNWIKKVLKSHDPFLRLIYQGRGHRVRALFDQSKLPARESAMRARIKRENLWLR